ncbi:MAG TPA: prepilin-type N-terminal cleavage/methylation domain-containing protein [Tepidisphaeraceae bacterium]|jgi:type II secretion system protein H|nr:prepilin-type N-terminal cleavage/methylation domain-containing protein [Tepidisphaeraceae bacterium]
MKRASHNFGFTLLELVLVLAILAAVMSMAAPTLRGWRQGADLRNCAEGFVAATHWARTRAASNARVYVVVIDAQNGAFAVKIQDGQNLKDSEGEFNQPISVPQGGTIQAMNSSRAAVNSIHFYPTGRVEPAVVRIADASGQTLTVECDSPADDFAIARQGQN